MKDCSQPEGRGQKVGHNSKGAPQGGPKCRAAPLTQTQRKRVKNARSRSDNNNEGGDKKLKRYHGPK